MAELAGIGLYKTVDPKFVRSAKAEADAMKNLGLTKEYIESRGGVNASGYYGDSWSSSKNLTPEEYDAAVAKALASKTDVGTAINQATLAKEAASRGMTVGQLTGGGPVTTASKAMTYTASDGKTFTDANAYTAYQATLDQQRANRQSAYDLLFQQFDVYGLGALVTPLKGLIESGINPSEFTIRLRETDAYKKRFGANAQRIQKGLRALSEAEYIGLEDQYQDVMRRYGLPQEYYTRGDMGRQEGFEKFIGGDVSPVELEDRIQTAQNRILFGPPQVTDALKKYFPEVTNGDILAYVLDPENSIGNIKRKVTISEIGGAAFQSALGMDVTRASELQRLGVTGEAYRQAAPTIRQAAERGSQLASFFKESPYTQQTAESMALNVGDAASAQEATRKLIEKERGLYSGQAGVGALSRERAGQF